MDSLATRSSMVETYGRETRSLRYCSFWLWVCWLPCSARAEHAGVLEMMSADIKHRVLLYVDDVVVFARPVAGELAAIKGILHASKGPPA
jgi:hypothetical protein